MQMATSATTDAGTRNTRHQFVTLVKQFYTCCQQQNKCQRCKPDWLGKDTSTNENVLGITNKVVRSRTIRRQVKPEKYNKQLLHVINSTPMTTPTASSFVMLPTAKMVARPQTTTETQTSLQQEETFPTTAAQSATPTNQPPAITELPMATAPSTQRARAPLPVPAPKRDVTDEVAEGSASKQQRTATRQTAPTRPEATAEPPATRTRITAVTVKTKKGQEIKALSNEDEQEATTEKILLEPWVKNTEGLNEEQTIEGMKQEIRSMKAQQVYTEVSFSNLTKAQQSKVIKSRWVLRQKGNSVRARIVAKGYTEEVNDNDDIYASTPIFCVLRLLRTMALTFNWIVRTGDISTAFLHAKAATEDVFMFPPTEFHNPEDNIVWKLNKAISGLRSSPKAWQNHLAETFQQLGMQRLKSEPNVFKTATGNAFILVYVDDLLFLGEPTVVNKLFADIQQQLLLRLTGDLTVGNISNKGDYYEISLATTYTTELLKEADMLNCNASPAPGTKATSTDVEQPLTTEERKVYRRAVGKLQWMTYTRPDISYATKELARSLTQPTTLDQQKLKHLLRYIKERNTTGSMCDQQSEPWTQHQTSTSSWTPIGQDAQQPGSQHRVHGVNNPLRQPHTSNNCTQQCRSRAIRHQHRSNRITSHQEHPTRSTQRQEGEH